MGATGATRANAAVAAVGVVGVVGQVGTGLLATGKGADRSATLGKRAPGAAGGAARATAGGRAGGKARATAGGRVGGVASAGCVSENGVGLGADLA